MGRTIRTNVPQHLVMFQPEWAYLQDFQKSIGTDRKETMMNVIDQDLYLTFLTILQYGLICSQTVKFQEVYIVPAAPQWRSYFVNVPSGQVRKNRSQLRQRDGFLPKTTQTESTAIQTRSKTGTVIRPPQCYQS